VTLLDHLRCETRMPHQRLEATPALRRLVQPDYTLGEYVGLLQAFFNFFEPLEAALARAAPQLRSLLGLRPRAPLLRADLGILGAEPAPAAGTWLPRVGDDSAALGCLYVVEGSKLGGRVIAGRLAQSLGATADRGASFFASRGFDVQADWRRLCALLREPAASVHRRGAVSAARETFAALEASLSRPILAFEKERLQDGS